VFDYRLYLIRFWQGMGSLREMISSQKMCLGGPHGVRNQQEMGGQQGMRAPHSMCGPPISCWTSIADQNSFVEYPIV